MAKGVSATDGLEFGSRASQRNIELNKDTHIGGLKNGYSNDRDGTECQD
jgi:hypothetical protein